MTPHPHIEFLSPTPPSGRFTHALFDFDGTLSLIREGWQEVMREVMLETLSRTPAAEPEAELLRNIDAFIARTTGLQTIRQMMGLREEVVRRHGDPEEPIAYKRRYDARLMARIRHRREALADGADPEPYLVPGARRILAALRERGVRLYCASGTDREHVVEEACLLGLEGFFDGGLSGALEDHRLFSKRQVIRDILRERGLAGDRFLGCGDGYVEIAETRAVGGFAVGVASDEVRRGELNAWKRERLIESGADMIVPDFAETDDLMRRLFPG